MLSVNLCQSMYRTAALRHKNCIFTPTNKWESSVKLLHFHLHTLSQTRGLYVLIRRHKLKVKKTCKFCTSWRSQETFYQNFLYFTNVINVKEIPFTSLRKAWLSILRFARKSPQLNNILWTFPTKFYPKRTKYVENIVKMLLTPLLKIWLNNNVWAFTNKFYPKRTKYLENVGKLFLPPYLKYDFRCTNVHGT